ncbi:type III-B CRISPR-associated protein Cas10/Cmr2 [Myxococcus virescens]|uniref:CRISPR-associated protein, Cmr2 family n=1 Tax=Myxococcus virescens TaxID=83456 RepID=A0A511HMD0_9BACT|nr:type III-B CRISPR-associated protein Cas10/Cmr2 [Myxococcus virescens]GEL74730.1 type III-B CRISPR-associated protein Cas10/Cmr2 [Myxococcus virescens]SDF23112.1 CRISPR-associated protein, Cmr2 family [Myxococcus virescens]
MKHVLVLKVGPVQGYIAQARRTRDLWYGSQVLSNLARAMAVSLLESRATLVFPHPDQARDARAGVANKVVALVEDAPEQVARRAREAAKSRLRAEWVRVFNKCQSMLIPGAEALAAEQLDTFLEVHAAWALVEDAPTGYADALAEAERALESRRGLREFAPWKQRPPEGTHKSSLDGARPSLLRRERQTGHLWRHFRIGLREELDALGVLKRAGGQPGQFVPVPSIGLAAWLQVAGTRHPELLARLSAACEARGFQSVSVRQRPWVESFPFDGQLLLPERWQPYFEEYAIPEPRQAAASFGSEFVAPLRDAMGADAGPFPYVACLVADGDRMGLALESLAKRSDGHLAHQRVSQALADFTRKARAIVEVEHRGVLVYAGGDDVLAFVTPMDAPACARALAVAFRASLEGALAGTGAEVPTLSVGLGIGHVLESLGELLALGRRAETAAKRAGRDALAILVAKHAGRERLWTAPWGTDPVARLESDMALLTRDTLPLPLGKVHEVAALARRFPAGVASTPELAEVLRDEAGRILARAEAGRAPKPLTPADVGLELSSATAPQDALEQWAARLLVADTFARAGRGLASAQDKEGAR